jgi:hypothetical protein
VCRFNAFGEDGAFAVSQIVNVLYVVMGGAVLYPRMWMTDLITPEMKALPQVPLFYRQHEWLRA